MKSSECRAKLKKYSAELCSPHLVDEGTVWPLLRKQQIFSENACVKIDVSNKVVLIKYKISKISSKKINKNVFNWNYG